MTAVNNSSRPNHIKIEVMSRAPEFILSQVFSGPKSPSVGPVFPKDEATTIVTLSKLSLGMKTAKTRLEMKKSPTQTKSIPTIRPI